MKETVKNFDKFLSVIAIVLIVLLAIILVGNLVFIIRGAIGGDVPPSILGVMPLIVTSNSMEGTAEGSFPEGSMIFIRELEGIEIGKVVAFLSPSSKEGFIVVTHRIHESYEENGVTYYRTKGDSNNGVDGDPITADMILGEYWFHVDGLGDAALFLKEPIGMLLCIGLPVLLFVGYDVVKKQITDKRKAKDDAALQAELERLRALAGEGAPTVNSENGEDGNEN